MAIAKMNKFTLFAFESHKEALLENLQKFEGVQFNNLQSIKSDYDFLNVDSEEKKASHFEGEQVRIKFVLDFLSKYIPKHRGLKDVLEGNRSLSYNTLIKHASEIKWETIYDELKSIDNRLIAYKNEASKLQTEIDSLSLWSNFDASFSDLNEINSTICLLGTIPKNSYEMFIEEFNSNILLSYVENICEIKDGFNLFIMFHKDELIKTEELIKKYGFSKSNLNYEKSPIDIIKDCKIRIEEIHELEKQTIEAINMYENKISDFEIMYEYYAVEINKARNCSNFIRTENVLAIEGWVPIKLKNEFENILKNTCGNTYFIEFTEPYEEDEVPIMLENHPLIEPYEIITAMYSLPNYKEVDPTPILAPFFFIFFGMMLSDAGYGAVLMIASALSLKLFNLDKGTKKFMKLFLSIGISTVIWGILYGSYFGDAPKLFNPVGIKPVWLDPSLDPMTVLMIAGAMGFIHIYTALGIKAYILIKDGKIFDALCDVGFWYFTLTGCLLILIGPASNMINLGTFGKYLAIIGAIGLVATQGRSNKGFGAKLAGGLFGLYGITGYLGDILSYSRLLALGLATGLIGSSFNLMIKLLGGGVVAWIFGILIFLGGHIFNLAINALGAYVHACRLQYLEFFGKFYSGGGKAFTPFKSKNKYINIIKD